MNKLNNYSVTLPKTLPDYPPFRKGIRRAPSRGLSLNKKEIKLSLKNALRYIPNELHKQLIPEFLEELQNYGRIYGYRYRPEGNLKAQLVDDYKGILEARAIQVMIDNNLDFDVALYPYELVTYGESGQVCQNWMQYRLIKQYLELMNEEQTLVIQSGHPLGLFPSHRNAPRVISTNGLMVGMFDTPEHFHRAAALGVANYGQMTAGGWMYIGPQGIVHGTYITALNAGRKYLRLSEDEDLKGRLFISSGLGGMSGAQPKALNIAGAVSITAEVDLSRIETRLEQGWVDRVSADLDEIFTWVKPSLAVKEPLSIAYHGNVVDLLEYVNEKEIHVDLLSDQTSCHAVYEGGYTPQNITFDEGRKLIKDDLPKFKELVNESLKNHFQQIKILKSKGSYFYDYGNSFLKAVFDAGVLEVAKNNKDTFDGFIFPSYVEDIMGPLCFDYGYGPFRWVCLSNNPEDLRKTDRAAMECIDPNRRGQDRDNYMWIQNAENNNLVVGTQARILYQDSIGRVKIALKFNEMIRKGEIGPIMLGRDHHDVSGTDSPFRETSNIQDGSNIMSDMAHHCWAGDIARGMTMCVLSNGGGVGTGKAYNGGFGMVLDGSERVDEILKQAMDWDVTNGVARRSWARNEHAIETINAWNSNNSDIGHILLPYLVNNEDLQF
jgi:urocanate hydratase